MFHLPRVALGMVGFFHDIATQQSIYGGESKLPLGQLGGLGDIMATPISYLPSVLGYVFTPNFAPPNWWPVLPYRLENPVDPRSWVGDMHQAPIDPRHDFFYHPNISSYHDKQNGDVLDIREVGVSGIWDSVSRGYQISYRTQSTLGWPQADVTTVLIPHDLNGKVVSYQLWEDSASLQCSPSYSIATGISDPTFDLLLMLGYVVNLPDHQGANSSFACGIKEGQSTLDSIRAYLNSRELIGLDPSNYDKIAMWGYSGGSIATGHAAELQPSYAPELMGNLVGALIGGFVTNITDTIGRINGGIYSGFAFAGIKGLGTEYPCIQRVICNNIRPGLKWRFNEVGKTCAFENVINNLFHDFWSYTYDPTGWKMLNDPVVRTALNGEVLGVKAVPEIPVVIFHGAFDEISDVNDVDRVVDAYCKGGARVHYYRLDSLEHVLAEILSVVDCLKWIAQFFDGIVPTECDSVQDALRATSFEYDPRLYGQYSNVVYGNWRKTGILKMYGLKPRQL